MYIVKYVSQSPNICKNNVLQMTSFIKIKSIPSVALCQILVTQPCDVPPSQAWCLQKSSAILPLEDRFFSKLNERRKKSERKALNKSKHSAEGNKSKTFRVDSWNCGNGSVLNKVNEIKHLIQQRRPHVLIIQEANIFHGNQQKVSTWMNIKCIYQL